MLTSIQHIQPLYHARMSIVGLSATDVITIAKFAARIISALREEGGAKTQYREAVRSLDSLQHSLYEIQELELSVGHLHHTDHLRTQTQTLIDLIAAFIKKIAKYDRSLGTASVRGRLIGGFRKAHWALRATRDLEDFRKLLTLQLETIKLILLNENL
jgi:hypothetical protein